MWKKMLIGAGSLLVAACSSGGAMGGMDLTMMMAGPDLAMAPGDMVAPGYPAGPYGPNNGDVIPNFTFQGYFAPTQVMGLSRDAPNVFGDVTMDMVRMVPGAKCGLWFFGGFT